jgi:hypothetical protein
MMPALMSDCWGLVYLIYALELKTLLPRYDVISAEDAMAATATMDDAILKGPWRQIEHGFEQPFDVTRIRRPCLVEGHMRRVRWHVGVVTRPGHLIHIEKMPGVLEVAFRDEHTFRHHYTMPPRDVTVFRHESQIDLCSVSLPKAQVAA